MRRPLLTLLLAASAIPAAAAAQPAPAGHANAPAIQAVPLTGAVRVDGVLDEAIWSSAPAATQFTQVVPEEGAPASERTEIRFAYDDVALYIGARMHDSAEPTTRMGRRDGSMEASDWLTLIFDSFHDHRTAYGFEINPSGLRRDQTRAETGEDDSWDPVWEAATSQDGGGWSAELRIPFSQLRFNPADVQTWGVQIERQIARRREFSVFSFTPTSQPGGIPRFGHLEGLRELQTGKRLEVLPYTVVKGESIDRQGNPFRDDTEAGISAGADLKYRVTPDLTLDVTVNPDFGQVEVDPAQVNLSAIETFYQEKRPFFVEGSQIFNFGAGGGNNVFYSRRIGRAPQLLPATSAYDVSDAASILGAAKLTGRSAGGWTIGVLDALTRREEALFLNPLGERDVTTAEPLSNYFVGRVRRDMRAGLSSLGGMLTTVHRDLDTERAEQTLRDAAYTGGVDFRHDWAERTWGLSGFVSGSHVTGSPEAIALAQRSPWRYFQRPDADHLDYDPTRTSLTGISTQVQLQHRRGRHWRYSLLGGTTTPGYEVNDIGFQYRADRIDAQANVGYVEPRPGSVLRSWHVNASGRIERNYDGATIMNMIRGFGMYQLLNYWNGMVGFGYTTRALDDRLTRGGPSSERPASLNINAELATDSRKAVSFSGGLGYANDDAGGWGYGAAVGIQLRPQPNWSLSMQPVYEYRHNTAQYLGAVVDNTATNTFGRRYLFSEIDQTTVALETRFDMTFTPDLSLQVYVQPYIASGDYGAPAQLARPGAYLFEVFGVHRGEAEAVDGGVRVYPEGRGGVARSFVVPDRDFTLRSLRGNAVLRWEYRPGSTLFVAWQQNRSDFIQDGVFDFGRDPRGLFDAAPDNVLVIKVNYWINP